MNDKEASSYNQSTPELAKLFKEMNDANAKFAKAMRGKRPPFTKLPEYAAAMACYRAYWAAVDKAEGRT